MKTTSQANLMLLLAVTSSCVLSLPLNSASDASMQGGEKIQETVEERIISFDPNVESEFTIKVGDVAYFTNSYRDLLTEQQQKSDQSSEGKQKRTATSNQYWLWPNCRIPYVIHDYYTEPERRLLIQALAHWEEHTCVRFVERTTERDYILIWPSYGCTSYIGKTSRQQKVSIGGSCFEFSSILHELGHVIGFYHEHNRPDRDEYVEIVEENLRSGSQRQFEKLRHDEVNLFGIGYDYNSVMHYNKDYFSKKSSTATIVALDPSIPIGEADGLSPLDILKTNLLCGCSNSTQDHPTKTTVVPEEVVTEPTPLPPHEFECGAVFDGVLSGSISSPGYGVYPHNSDCEWTIRVTEGYRIKLTIEMDIDYMAKCEGDYLNIHERLNRAGSGLATYCNSNRNVTKYTITNTAYIRFHTDGSNQRPNLKGFKLSFETEDFDECSYGGYCSHGCTNLPGSFVCHCPKGFYMSSDLRQCYDINECALDKGGCDHKCMNKGGSFHCVCEDGFTLLSDGKTCVEDTDEVTDPCLNTNCEHSCVAAPSDVHTAMCLCPKGYDLSTDGVSCDEVNECLARNGGCQHGCENTPGSYQCSCRQGYKLADDGLTCEDIDECASNNGGCSDICLNTDSSYECICNVGQTLQPDLHSCAADHDKTFIETFIGEPIILCNNIFTTANGDFQTPDWPETYPFDFECQWNIEVPSSDCSVELTFDTTAFGIAGKSSEYCPKDHLKIYNADDVLTHTICDLVIPSPITTSGNTKLNFLAGPSHGPLRKGFKITYATVCPTTPPPTTRPTTIPTTRPTTPPPTTRPTTIPTTRPTTPPPTTRPTTIPTTRPTTVPTTLPPTTVPASLCGGILKDTSGSIQTPLWPATYPFNFECDWTIEAPSDPDCDLRLTFDTSAFGIAGKTSDDCPRDYLRISDSNEKVIQNVCDLTVPSPITSSDSIRLFFLAGPYHGPRRLGFKMTYTTICPTTPPPTMPTNPPTTRPTTIPTTLPSTTTPPTTSAAPTPNCLVLPPNPQGSFSCNQFIGPGSNFGPNNFPTGPVTDTMSCQWIGFSSGPLRVHFKYFDIPSNNDCSSNYVAVHDGYLTGAPLIKKKMCGEKCEEFVVTGTANFITIVMEVTSPGDFRGFYAHLEQI